MIRGSCDGSDAETGSFAAMAEGNGLRNEVVDHRRGRCPSLLFLIPEIVRSQPHLDLVCVYHVEVQ